MLVGLILVSVVDVLTDRTPLTVSSVSIFTTHITHKTSDGRAVLSGMSQNFVISLVCTESTEDASNAWMILVMLRVLVCPGLSVVSTIGTLSASENSMSILATAFTVLELVALLRWMIVLSTVLTGSAWTLLTPLGASSIGTTRTHLACLGSMSGDRSVEPIGTCVTELAVSLML